MRYKNGTVMDGQEVRVSWDAGFKEGRQFGRGVNGGQVSLRDHGEYSRKK